MFGKQDENWSQFSDLIKIIENSEKKQAPENFTPHIMARISEVKETDKSLSLRNSFATKFDFGFNAAVTRAQCAFYFLITGFFYFVLGFIMMIGLPLPVVMQNNGWLSFQPVFGLLLAAELIVLGIVIYKKGESAVLFARLGTVLYAALIILNCWIGTFYIQPATALLFIGVFSMTGLVLAVLLGLAVAHYNAANICSEVH